MIRGFPGGSADTPANTGDIGLILESGRCKDPWVWKMQGSLGLEDARKMPRTWQPPQVFCLKKPMTRGAWRARVHRVAKESNTM